MVLGECHSRGAPGGKTTGLVSTHDPKPDTRSARVETNTWRKIVFTAGQPAACQQTTRMRHVRFGQDLARLYGRLL